MSFNVNDFVESLPTSETQTWTPEKKKITPLGIPLKDGKPRVIKKNHKGRGRCSVKFHLVSADDAKPPLELKIFDKYDGVLRPYLRILQKMEQLVK